MPIHESITPEMELRQKIEWMNGLMTLGLEFKASDATLLNQVQTAHVPASFVFSVQLGG